MNDELNSFLPQIPPSLHSETVMQDVHGILGGGSASGGLVGGGGRIFGDRRMRAAPHHHQQALNCPRCDSLNTKFCYYNNYNLSQPRHFCKNCRRYWTKGGVLRNVPVGGGCRKSKRSSKRKQSENSPQEPLSSSAAKDRHVSNSGSSSESTSAKAAGGEAIGVVSELSSSAVFPFSDQAPGKVAVTFNSLALAPMPVFTEARGFVSLMEGDQHQSLFGYGNMEMEPETETTPFGMQQQNQVDNNNNNQLLLQNLSSRDWQKEKMDGVDNWGQGIFDQTVQVDLLSNRRTGDGVLAGGDWHGVSGGGGGGGHLGMFDLTPGSDWSQSSQWHESDHHLYLPP